MAGKNRREGYLLVDHRFSPGIDPALAHSLGTNAGPAVGKDRVFEAPTVTCCHCNTVVILNPLRRRARNYCAKCDQYVCDSPACGLDCKNFERMLDYVQNLNARAEELGEPVTGLPDLKALYNTVTVSASLPPENDS